uniref:uncharacterized protein LOC122601879 n=1 Tax=Erigeron canadensis TaxID=72917 RepID=UPI001CB9453E|nr:uncharacterized protein LOC122601879 [Erigeron canadensis]
MKSKSKGSSSSGGKSYLKINVNRRKRKPPIVINFCDDETESDDTQSDESQSDSDMETLPDKHRRKSDSKDKYKFNRRKKAKKIGRTRKHNKDKNLTVHSDEDSDFEPVLEAHCFSFLYAKQDSDDYDNEEVEEEDDNIFEDDDGEDYDLDSEDENDYVEVEEQDGEDVDDNDENENEKEVEEENEPIQVAEEEQNDKEVRLDEDDDVFEEEVANDKEVRLDDHDDAVEAEGKSTNRKGRTKFEHKRLFLRNSQEKFHTFMNKLNNKQKADIKDLRFGSLINFPISSLPTMLACYVLEKFDHTECVFDVDGRVIKVTKEMVHEVFGIPIGDKKIPYRVNANHSHKQVKKWKKQFNTEKPSLQELYSIMIKQDKGGALFKLNFLVLFVTTMMEGIKSNSLNHKFLQYTSKLKEVRCLDWCDFLLTCLINTKKDWKNQRQFSGPIMFLMVINVHELKRQKNVQFPLIKNWTLDDLKLIESEKLKNGEFDNVVDEDVTMLSPKLKRKRALEKLLSRKKQKDEKNKEGHGEQVKQKETARSNPDIIEDKPFTNISENNGEFECMNDNPFTTTQTLEDFNTFTVESKLLAIKRTVKERLLVKEWLTFDTNELIKMGLAIDSKDDDLNNYYTILNENITIEDFYRNNPFFSDKDFVRKSKLRKRYRNDDEAECSKKMDVDFSGLEDFLEDEVLGDKNNGSSIDKRKKHVVKNVDQKNHRKQGETKKVNVEQPISMQVNFDKGKHKQGETRKSM